MIHRLYETELTPVRKHVLEATSQEMQNARRYRRQLDFDAGPGGLAAQLPISANIELTNDCQLDCTMCPRTADPRPPRYLSFTDYDRILDRLRDAGIIIVSLQYLGEPTLHPEFIRCVTRAKEKIELVGFSTNGLLLIGDLAAAVLALPVDRISVSLDGSDADGYHRVRKGSDLATVEQNLREFKAARDRNGAELPLVVVRTMLIPGEVPRLDTLRQWAALADVLELRYCLPAGPALTEIEPDRFPCSLAFRHLTVMVDGQARICCASFSDDLAVGNLRDQSVAELWNGDAAWRLRKSLLDPARLPGICRRCRLLSRRFRREFAELLRQTGLVTDETGETVVAKS